MLRWVCVCNAQEKYEFTPTATVIVNTTGPNNGELRDLNFSN